MEAFETNEYNKLGLNDKERSVRAANGYLEFDLFSTRQRKDKYLELLNQIYQITLLNADSKSDDERLKEIELLLDPYLN